MQRMRSTSGEQLGLYGLPLIPQLFLEVIGGPKKPANDFLSAQPP